MNSTELLQTAAEALEHAHAPYSKYRVGAAVVTEDGTIFTGCNVENASYGLTNCAERTAIFSAVAAGHRKFTAVAIVSASAPTPFPCGACRQVMTEFCAPDCTVLIAPADDLESCKQTTMGELLPMAFKLDAS